MKKIFIGLLTAILFLNLFAFNSNQVNALSKTEIEYTKKEYSEFDLSNVDKFTKYLEDINIDIFEEEDVKYLASNFLSIYFNAVSLHKIKLIPKDILLGDFEVSE